MIFILNSERRFPCPFPVESFLSKYVFIILMDGSLTCICHPSFLIYILTFPVSTLFPILVLKPPMHEHRGNGLG